MHSINKLRLLAGIPIDPMLEQRKVITEGAFAGCENEEKSNKTYAKDADGNKKKDYPGTENCGCDKPNKSAKDCMVKEMSDEIGADDSEQTPVTSNQFKDGNIVIYDDGIHVVVLADANADMVGIIPAGMADASKEEKNRSVEMVKPDKIRKPTEEEMSVMKQTPEERAKIDDDMAIQFSAENYDPPYGKEDEKEEEIKHKKELSKSDAEELKKKKQVKESTHNYAPGNKISHKDTVSDPINVVGQGDKQWANSLDPKNVKSEIPLQRDHRGEQSMNEDNEKVKVPSSIKSSLKEAIRTFRSEAEKQGKGHTSQENAQLFMDTADAYEELLGYLDEGTVMSIKRAQVFASSLMGPMLHKLPDGAWDFIVNGGQKRSLADYMIKLKK